MIYSTMATTLKDFMKYLKKQFVQVEKPEEAHNTEELEIGYGLNQGTPILA